MHSNLGNDALEKHNKMSQTIHNNTSLRLLTAIILAPLAIFALLYVPDTLIITASITAIAAYEWASIHHCRLWLKVLFSFLCFMLATGFTVPFFGEVYLTIAAFAWAFSFLYILRFSASDPVQFRKMMISGLFLLPAFAIAIEFIQAEWGALMTITLLSLAWVVDSMGYIVGKRWGENKLIPYVSPNKTWEGFYAQLLSGSAMGIFLSYAFDIDLLKAITVMFLTTLICVAGDLFESCLKRTNDVKDSGIILPGHGGVLDRLDGLIAAAPAFWLLLKWL